VLLFVLKDLIFLVLTVIKYTQSKLSSDDDDERRIDDTEDSICYKSEITLLNCCLPFRWRGSICW